ENRLEPKLGDTLVTPNLSECGARALAAEKRSGALRVPRAALVVPDPPCAGLEHRIAHDVEGLARHEDDELAHLGLHAPTLRNAERKSPQLAPAVRCVLLEQSHVLAPTRQGEHPSRQLASASDQLFLPLGVVPCPESRVRDDFR